MSTTVRPPPPPPPPTPVDPGQSALDFVKAMADPELQRTILENEQRYAPEYTNLELQQINQLLSGSEDLPGLKEIIRQSGEDFGALDRSVTGQQREADIIDVERYGERASAAFRKANPELTAALGRAEELRDGPAGVENEIRALINSGVDPIQAEQIARSEFNATAGQIEALVAQGVPEAQAAQLVRGEIDQSAARIRNLVGQGVPEAEATQIIQSRLGSGLEQSGLGQLQAGEGETMLQQQGLDFLSRGGGLTPLQQRAVEQQARAAGVSRGRGLDSSSITNEIASRLAQEMQVEQQNVATGAGLLNQGFGMQQQRLGTAGNIYGQNLTQEERNALLRQQVALANQGATIESRAQGLGAEANIMGTQVGLATQDASFLQEARLANQKATLQNRGQGLEALLGLSGDRASMATQDATLRQQANLNNQDVALRQKGLNLQSLFNIGQTQQSDLANKRAYALSLIEAQRATASDPFQAILGRPSNAAKEGSNLSQFASNLAQQQLGPNLFDPNTGINLALQQNQNTANYNSNIFSSQASLAGQQSQAKGALLGGALGGLGSLLAAPGTSVIGKLVGCWVAREVYGEDNPKWRVFREWLTLCAPKWFYNLYVKHGERFAAWLKDKHVLKAFIRYWMDGRVETMFKLNEREETC
jgi:hypothetical protein